MISESPKELDFQIIAEKKETFNPSEIILTTNFLYANYVALPNGAKREDCDTDGIRGDLAIELLSKTVSKGVGVVACDGGSSSDFLLALEEFNNKGLTVVNSDIQGRAPQRRKAFETASSRTKGKVIVYTQPEKASLVDHLLEISKPILEGNADIVIPKREEKLFKSSYPKYMWQSEVQVNNTYDWLMKRFGLIKQDESFDWFFGPIVFRNDPEMVSIFLKKYETDGSIYSRIGANTDPEKNSGSHYFPIIEALYKKKSVVSVEVPFEYPKSQRENEISKKAIADFIQRRKYDSAAYRLEALHLLAYLRGDRRSKIREL